MKYPFLREFSRRMKVVGMYAVLLSNSGQKQKWKQYGFDKEDEQITMLFATLLFIMEQSLREENCTLDEVATFIDDLNGDYFHKSMSIEDCHDLGDFLVNTVLSNDGLQMHFDAYDFAKGAYQEVYISYVANKIVYDALENRRTSYYLTENGYSLLLGTLEVENNMRLTIQEIIFNEHLKKRNFDKALDDIKNIFELMRIEKLKNDEAISRVRQNILNFSVEEYSRRVDETFGTIRETRAKLEKYKNMVNDRVKVIESEHIDIEHISEEDAGKLEKLREIVSYLDRTIDCHMGIMHSYNDYREICAREMENFLRMTRVERFSFSQDIFEKILDDATLLSRTHLFLHPLFNRNPKKIFNVNKVFTPQRKREEHQQEESVESLDFDEAGWLAEQRQKAAIKNTRYRSTLLAILEACAETGSTTLAALCARCVDEPAFQERLIPSISIFKEIMVDLIRTAQFSVAHLREEHEETLQVRDTSQTAPLEGLKIGELVLSIVDQEAGWHSLEELTVRKISQVPDVLFRGLMDEEGRPKQLACTDICFRVKKEL
ncbi:MAG: hypothetical protein IKO41_06075 [Lachnospiraceae bacterium]|nr:hypothetical protein [Desulfovibrio sp.]MBR4605777.1 hypothetical protein [Lachnospiraceae bacterium]